jgi:hypothetical protein
MVNKVDMMERDAPLNAGTVDVEGQVIYRTPPRKPHAFRRAEGWQKTVIDAVGLPWAPPNADAWWNEVFTSAMYLGHPRRAAQPLWGTKDFESMANTAQKLQDLCKAYTDHSGDTDAAPFYLIGDLQILTDWAKAASLGQPKRKRGAPKKTQEQECLARLGLLFQEAFGSAHAVSGNHDGPFARFVVALLKEGVGLTIDHNQLREKLRDRSERRGGE